MKEWMTRGTFLHTVKFKIRNVIFQAWILRIWSAVSLHTIPIFSCHGTDTDCYRSLNGIYYSRHTLTYWIHLKASKAMFLTQCSRLLNSFNQNDKTLIQKLHCSLKSNFNQSWNIVPPPTMLPLPATKLDLKSNNLQSVCLALARRNFSSITNGIANEEDNLDMRVFRLGAMMRTQRMACFPNQ